MSCYHLIVSVYPYRYRIDPMYERSKEYRPPTVGYSSSILIEMLPEGRQTGCLGERGDELSGETKHK